MNYTRAYRVLALYNRPQWTVITYGLHWPALQKQIRNLSLFRTGCATLLIPWDSNSRYKTPSAHGYLYFHLGSYSKTFGMSTTLAAIIDESIQLELNVAALYTVFHDKLPKHQAFWWKLVLEEQNHAALIKSGKLYFEPLSQFPENLLAPKLEQLKETNNQIAAWTESYRLTHPSAEIAFNLALYLEQSAGEIHFQEFMEREPCNNLERTFRQLNNFDQDHAKRLRQYMEEHGIPIKEGNPDTYL